MSRERAREGRASRRASRRLASQKEDRSRGDRDAVRRIRDARTVMNSFTVSTPSPLASMMSKTSSRASGCTSDAGAPYAAMAPVSGRLGVPKNEDEKKNVRAVPLAGTLERDFAKHVLVFKRMMSTKTIADRLYAHHPLWPSIPTIRDILREVSSCARHESRRSER